MIVLRVLLVAAGLAAGLWALERDTAVRGCVDAGQAAFRSNTPAEADAAATRTEADCRGGAPLASAAAVLLRRDAPEAARRLAEEAVRREPENSAGWVAYGKVAEAAGDTAGLTRARSRLRLLDPRNRVLG